ncbi:hypothetical protein INN71_10835 [Nocardioides sp. ChNu-153]|uniref:hypothetical protein n=1 Tax=unclassified Nocardioides TaxID=2615069 RepID=UPI002406CF9C|nr:MULTISPECIES: hypothetical protein [unclassified Nocardioides]MDF9715780.1 class I SAM-dependent methyltransferase [Nocardioides sp. ChNu-99]MDN7121885.1 hypothetical protein [Nocardioides sp. ChNu-153]
MDQLSAQTRTSPFPPDAAAWLAGQSGRTVVLVGDPRGTATLAEALAALGYDVRASEDGSMSLPDRSVDAIVALHELPDLEVAARVLRPGGQVAVLAQEHDQRIPWVRKLGAALRLGGAPDPTAPLVASPYFGSVGTESFRHWQVVTRDGLAEVVRRLPAVLARSHSEQERAVADALALYDDYGRGPDGMQLPWISHCHRAPVLAEAWATVTERVRAAAEAAELSERAARNASRRAAEGDTDGTDGTDATPDASGERDDRGEAATSTPPADAEAAEAAGGGERRTPPRPQPTFDIGDTAEGVITYVVDTGEMPPVRAALGDDRARPARRGAPPAASTRPAAPAAEVEEPDEGDGDLLIRFR